MLQSAMALPRARRDEVRPNVEAALPPPNDRPEVPASDLRTTLADELDAAFRELAARLESNPPAARQLSASSDRSGDHELWDRIRFIGALLAAVHDVDPAHVRPGRAGLGSTVLARDTDSGEELSFTLVPFDLVDGTTEKVTLASPIGQAVVGARRGAVVNVRTPARARNVRIERVATIWDALAGWRGADGARRRIA